MRNRYMGFLNFLSFLFMVVFVASLTTYGKPLSKEAPLSVLPKVGVYCNSPLQSGNKNVGWVEQGETQQSAKDC